MEVLQDMKPHGFFTLKHFRNVQTNDDGSYKFDDNGNLLGDKAEEDVVFPNLVTTEGKDYMANIAYNNTGTQQTAWYLALFDNNLAVESTDVASAVAARLGELTTGISEANRPTWVKNVSVANTGLLSSNSESPAVFTVTAGTTVYGAYMISNNAKGGTSGVMLAGSNFAPSRVVLTSDVLQLTYSIALT